MEQEQEKELKRVKYKNNWQFIFIQKYFKYCRKINFNSHGFQDMACVFHE